MKYIGTYKVMKVYRKSMRRKVIQKGLSIEQAKQLVNSYPDSNRCMVYFTKQYYSTKYFV